MNIEIATRNRKKLTVKTLRVMITHCEMLITHCKAWSLIAETKLLRTQWRETADSIFNSKQLLTAELDSRRRT